MALILTVQRGYTFQADQPFDADDLNAAALPVVVLDGTVGSTDLGPGAVNSTHTVPGAYFYGAATGAANAYSVSLNPSPTSLATGLWVCFKANVPNTGPATVNVSGFGAKSLTTQAGEALAGGEIVAGQMVWIQYDGTAWQIVSERSLPKTLYAVDMGAVNACAIVIPGITVSTLAQLTGQEIIFKAAAANTGAVTLKVNGLTAAAITKQGSTALTSGDIQTGALVSVAYDGTVFQITSFMAAPALPAVGAVGTQLYPYSITVDTQGRVTGRSGGMYMGTAAFPSVGSAQAFTHSLGRTPAFVRAVAVMGASTEGGYLVGDEFDIGGIYGGPVPDEPTIFGVSANDTSITVARLNDSTYFTSKTGNQIPFTPTLWTLKVYAW